MQETPSGEIPSIKLKASPFDFFNEFKQDSSPRISSFRYYKTDGTAGGKLNRSRSYETVIIAVQAPRSKAAREETNKHTTINLQANNLIRSACHDANGSRGATARQVRHLKMKLLAYYKPTFAKEWIEHFTTRRTILKTGFNRS
jgi:hypothetical protein